MNTINKIAMVTAKIAEILHWIGAASMGAVLIFSIAAKDWLGNILDGNISFIGSELSTYGFEVSMANPGGYVSMTAVTLFSVGSVIILLLFSMIFRNAYLILKTAEGKTWFAKGSTPFQKDIVRMLREIGIFLISVPVVGFIIGIITRAVAGIEFAEISVNFESIVIGLLVLCLSQFFTYGSELQEDVNGLL